MDHGKGGNDDSPCQAVCEKEHGRTVRGRQRRTVGKGRGLARYYFREWQAETGGSQREKLVGEGLG